MGRYVLSAPRRLGSSKALKASTAWELWLSRLQLLAAVSFLLGCLSLTSVAPYIAHHRWNLFAVAGGVYAMLDIRDLCVLLQRPQDSEVETERRASANLLTVDVCAAFLMGFGSLLLVNSAVLARFREDLIRASRWQFVGSFATYLVGYACNSMSYHDDAIDVIETRNVVVFQMSMSSVLNLIGALLNTPLVEAAENEEPRAVVRAWLHGIAGMISFAATLVNHFHVRAFMLNEELLFAELMHHENMERLAKIAAEESLKPTPGLLRRILNAVRRRLGYGNLDLSTKSNDNCTEYHSLASESVSTSSSFEPGPGYDMDNASYDDRSGDEAVAFSHIPEDVSAERESLQRSVADDRDYYESRSQVSPVLTTSRSRKGKRTRREREPALEDAASNKEGVSRKRRHRAKSDSRRPRKLSSVRSEAEQEHVIYRLDEESEQDSLVTCSSERRRAYGHR
jgi:hypothetical protein